MQDVSSASVRKQGIQPLKVLVESKVEEKNKQNKTKWGQLKVYRKECHQPAQPGMRLQCLQFLNMLSKKGRRKLCNKSREGKAISTNIMQSREVVCSRSKETEA